ncbi:hypothetical protein [Lentiprolixibacter aurantiacus]|uniref:Uncharacterized protein n=1 Tax=Lentiprolixibacter aurantiacus TaxID=2993939 RepID=A0AAE3MHT7_9FLAO|nr:hypothetical protein [Lentiprolixibacter aurantiacus]MCX2718030.1 hypothetical protein [Lentiprolixibacter aurantiacus]
MNNKNATPLYFFLFCLLFLSCGEKKVEKETAKSEDISIYDFANEADKNKFDKLNLDETHPNLLSPQISTTDFDQIMESWTELHQEIGKYLNANDFDWQVDDHNINILHKFYFDPNGKIKSYFFRILNNEVSYSKRKEYAGLVLAFARDYQLPLNRDAQYAQCGKTRYMSN